MGVEVFLSINVFDGFPPSAINQQLKVALAERGDLVRGLRQAKTFNDQLAKV